MQMNERVKGIHLGKYWLIVDKIMGCLIENWTLMEKQRPAC